MLCPTCHSSNPDDNRFCGKCGAALTNASQAANVRPSNELPPELIEFDRKIPLIAEPGADRRNRVPENIREKVREVVERDRLREAERQNVPSQNEPLQNVRMQDVPVRDVPVQNAAENTPVVTSANESRTVRMPATFLGMDMTADDDEIERERLAEADRRKASTVVEPVITREPVRRISLDDERAREAVVDREALDRDRLEQDRLSVERAEQDCAARIVQERRLGGGNGFLSLDQDPEPSSGGVSGPSFLGLGGPEYEIEDEDPESHTRRNVALVVLLLLIGLGATQWSEIRDQGLPFVKNGTQKVILRVKGKLIQPSSANDANASNANGSSASPSGTSSNGANGLPSNSAASNDGASNNTATSNGAPNIEVAPTNADVKKPEPSADASGANGASTATNAASANPSTNAAATPGPATGPATTGGVAGAAVASGATTGSAAGASGAANNATRTSDAAGTNTHPESASNAKDASSDNADEVTSEPAKKSADTRSRRGRKPSGADRPQITDEQSQAGSAELMQANATSDPQRQNALLWQAVKKGNPDASVKLAENYINGKGVEKSCEQAMMLLRSASAHTNARARGKLGAMYATGECVQQDRVQAYHWMSLALQANPSSEWTAQYRDRLWSQMSPGEQMRAGRER